MSDTNLDSRICDVIKNSFPLSMIIDTSERNFKEKDNITRKFEDMDFTINPTSAGENDSHTVVVTITEGS